MKRKGDAHEALSLLFHRDGVPPAMVMDGSKEQTLGDFRRKLKEADCHLRQTEPYSPWMNAAESAIRELKRGVSRKMIRTRSPKVFGTTALN
jgi:transposase